MRYPSGLGFLSVAAALAIPAGALASSNVLVWSTGNSQSFTDNVAAWLYASGQFDSVTGIESVPTLSFNTLNSYDRILYYSNGSAGQDPDAIGDVLYQFSQTGKRLVLSTFAWANQGGNTLAGDIIDLQASPLLVEGSSLYSNVTMASNDGSALFTGVNSVGGYFHDDVKLSANGTQNATWSDNEPMVASNGNIIGVNLFPDDGYGNLSGDYRQLFVNALTDRVPAPGSGAVLGLAGLCAARRRR